MKKAAVFLIIGILFTGFTYSQNAEKDQAYYLTRLQEGILLYSQGNLREAIDALRPVLESPSKPIAGEAMFWIALSELSDNNYQKSLDDFRAFRSIDPTSRRIAELGYHEGRALYYLGRFSEAIVTFKTYSDSFGPNSDLSFDDMTKKSSALYWIGECLYSLGQFDRAGDVFLLIVNSYPHSAKFEASSYRVSLINQKKIETELLELLNWSHEESLRIMEEYQRRERAYDQAILSYQRRINEMMKDTRLADLESSNAQYQQQLAVAEERIRSLENRQNVTGGFSGISVAQVSTSNPVQRLLTMRSSAFEIREELQRNLGISMQQGVGR